MVNRERFEREEKQIMSMFSFVILTDSHVHAQPSKDDVWWNIILVRNGLEILSIAVDDTNALKPDFVVHCGDVTDAGDTPSFRAAGEILRRLNCPLYFTPGNHDTEYDGAREQAGALLNVPGPPFYRTITHQGWRLLFIDTSYWIHLDGSVDEYVDRSQLKDIYIPDSQVDWVRRQLQDDPHTPTICFTHTMLTLRDAYPGGTLPHDGTKVDRISLELLGRSICQNPRLKTVLTEYDCIKAVFSGHGHRHDCIVQGSTLFCQTGALAEYPNEFRLVHVYLDRMDIQVVPLSRGNFPELSYQPHKGNHWLAGRPQDRTYSHPLPPDGIQA